MAKRESAALDLVRELPEKTRKKLNLTDLKSIAGAVLIKDRIEQFFDACYRHEAALRKYKVENGYCGGRPYCMVRTGDGSLCKACRDEKANPKKRHIHRSEYGAMRLKERRAAAAEKTS